MKQLLIAAVLLLFIMPCTGQSYKRGSLIEISDNADTLPHKQNFTMRLGIGGIGGYFALSAGVEYERYIDRTHYLSATLRASGYIGGTIQPLAGEQHEGEIRSKTSGIYAAPGLRFHPFRNDGNVDLGLGVFAPLGNAGRKDVVRYQYSDTETGHTSSFFGAVVAELSANFLHKNNVTFSLFLDVGYAYSKPEAREYRQQGNPYSKVLNGLSTPGYVQFGVNLYINAIH